MATNTVLQAILSGKGFQPGTKEYDTLVKKGVIRTTSGSGSASAADQAFLESLPDPAAPLPMWVIPVGAIGLGLLGYALLKPKKAAATDAPKTNPRRRKHRRGAR